MGDMARNKRPKVISLPCAREEAARVKLASRPPYQLIYLSTRKTRAWMALAGLGSGNVPSGESNNGSGYDLVPLFICQDKAGRRPRRSDGKRRDGEASFKPSLHLSIRNGGDQPTHIRIRDAI
jgi:hypothetical protein